MKFGPVPVEDAGGAILAHSILLPGGRLRKGRRLEVDDLARLRAAGVTEVTVARLEPGDLDEDEAAARIARALVHDPAAQGLELGAAAMGRVNLVAARDGVLELDAAAIRRLNAVDEAVTVATLAPFARVVPGELVATVKIIPFGVAGSVLEAAVGELANGTAIAVRGVELRTASLLSTRIPGMGEKLLAKGVAAVSQRLTALGIELVDDLRPAHAAADIAAALGEARGDMVLILTASMTADRRDVAPRAVEMAGGRIERLGIPVDPGNLVFLGTHRGRPVIGLPGSARSPKRSGVDWVIERVACGIALTPEHVAGMAVGGLLKEVPSRPAPRALGAAPARRAKVSALVLAAGAARRMRGRDKLLESVDGRPLLRRVVDALAASRVAETVVVLPPAAEARRAALAGAACRIVENPRAAEGMGTSIAAGIGALAPDADAVMIVPADMPELGPRDFDRLIEAFAPGEGREIVRATGSDGRPGHPVIFGRRFFELLRQLEGDVGARALIRDYDEFLVDVPLPGMAALTDLDTPEAWAAWRRETVGPTER